MTTYRSPSRWYITGVMRSSPLRAPTVVRSISWSPNGPTPFPALAWNSWMVASFQSAIATSLTFLKRQERREKTDPAASQLGPEVVARLTKELAGYQSREGTP